MKNFLVAFGCIALVGCGATVDTASSGTTSSTGTQAGSGAGSAAGGGGGTSTSSSGLADASSSAVGGSTGTSAGGAGAAGGSGGATGTVGSGGSGGSGGQPCQGIVHMVVDNGAPEGVTASCKGTWGASKTDQADGYEFAGGPIGAPHGVEVDGCMSTTTSEGIELGIDNAAGPGTYTTGYPRYIDPNGMTWGMSGDAFHVVITKLESVGGVIEGSFSVTASNGGNAAHSIDGTFHVCHVMNEFAP